MPSFNIPDTGRQVFVANFTAQLRQTGLHEAVSNAASKVDSTTLRTEIAKCAPSSGLAVLQGTGVRDEEVFAVPCMLRKAPGILAYYRLLLGVSQKQFYPTSTGLNIFKPMEDRQLITVGADHKIDDLCLELNQSMSNMLQALPHGSLRIDVDQLPILTLGAQADGSWRTRIGTKATQEVFEALKGIVRNAGRSYTETVSSITVINNSNRDVTLMLAPDPDVVIREDFGRSLEYKAAIEIKGGTDYSNIHNRAGEAEKSHQKALLDGAGACWTVIDLARADMQKLRQESPTTREWIDLSEVQRRSGPTWDRLNQITRSAMGI